jgi:hypothetical protein
MSATTAERVVLDKVIVAAPRRLASALLPFQPSAFECQLHFS